MWGIQGISSGHASEHDRLTREEFHAMLMTQLHLYVCRRLNRTYLTGSLQHSCNIAAT